MVRGRRSQVANTFALEDCCVGGCVDAIIADLKQALRTFRGSPGFVVAAIGAITLGIGAKTAIFSIFDAVLLRPLNVPEADRVANSDGRHDLRSARSQL
jgi:hypothetical protein